MGRFVGVLIVDLLCVVSGRVLLLGVGVEGFGFGFGVLIFPFFSVVCGQRLGEDGMLLSTAGKILKTIPTAAREVYDVSGAGDTALAALVLALAAGAKLETAAHFANAAAGVVVGKLGTATVTPTELKAYVSHR